MKDPTTISLVRHGPVHNPADIYYGRLEGFPLSPSGLELARQTASHFGGKPVAAIYSSPRLRAWQTAWVCAESLGFEHVHICPLLDEVYSYFDGRPVQELMAREWNIYSGIPPPFEQPNDVHARMQKFMLQLRHAYAGRHVIAVTHGDPIAFTLLWADRQTIAPGVKPNPYPPPASIASFYFLNGRKDEIPTYERHLIQ